MRSQPRASRDRATTRAFADARELMVRRDVRARGVRDARVLTAMLSVPREEFVPVSLQSVAYADRPLPIGHDQTISQPYVVASMLEALELRPTDRLLEVGSGSGYAVAIASLLCREAVGIECVQDLASDSVERLARLGYRNARVLVGDGSEGAPDGSPWDAILVSAAAPAVPPQLLAQLADGGRMVIPVSGPRGEQHLLRIQRRGDELDEIDLGGVAFVPLVGAAGFPN